MRITAAILFLLVPVCLWGCGIQDTDDTGETPEVSALRLTLTALPGFAEAPLPELITRKTGKTVEVDLAFGEDVEIPSVAGWSLTYESELCSPEQIEFTESLNSSYLHMASDREEGRVVIALANGARETSQEEEEATPGLCRVTFSFEPFSKRAFSQPEISASDEPLLSRDEGGLRVKWNCGLYGDLDGDLKVGPLDLPELVKPLAETEGDEPIPCDLNQDGLVDQLDADVISRYCGACLTGYRVERVSPDRRTLAELEAEALDDANCTAFDGNPGFGDVQYTVTPLIEGGLRGRVVTTPVVRISPPPGKVRGFRVEGGDGIVTLQWWAPEGRSEPAGYNAYVRASDSEAWEPLAENIKDTTYEFVVEDPRVLLQFRAAAVNEDGLEGDYSPIRTYSPSAPLMKAPEQPDCLSRLASILIEWEPDPDYRHVVYRAESPDGAWERIGETGFEQSLFDDFDVLRGSRYYYRIARLDQLGNESPFSATQAGRAIDHRYPRVQQNRVFNGGFELGGAFWQLRQTDSPLEEWEYSIVSLGEAYTGDYAIGLNREPRPELKARRPGPAIGQVVKLKPDTSYRFGFHSRADGVAMLRAEVLLDGRTESKNIVSGLDWELKRISFRTGRQDSLVELSLMLEKGDAVYLDDIRVEEADGVTPEMIVYPDEKPLEAEVVSGGIAIGEDRPGLFFVISGTDQIEAARIAGADGVVASPLPEVLDAARVSGLYVIGGGDFVQGIVGTTDPQFLPLALEFYGAHPSIAGWLIREPESGLSKGCIENCLSKDAVHPILLDAVSGSIEGAAHSFGEDVQGLDLSTAGCIDEYIGVFMTCIDQRCGVVILEGWNAPVGEVRLEDCVKQIDTLLSLSAAGALVKEESEIWSFESGASRLQWTRNDSNQPAILSWSELGVNRDKATIITNGDVSAAGLTLAASQGFVILEED